MTKDESTMMTTLITIQQLALISWTEEVACNDAFRL